MKNKEIYNYTNNYNSEHYARISALIPKADKSAIEQHYKRRGYKGMSEYIKALIRADMNATR